jgi:hypothetical protein
MDDEVGRSKWAGCPFGFLGAMALILAVEGWIVEHKDACLGAGQWGYRIARTRADSGDPRRGVLCFGDSLLKAGLAPTVIEAESGLPAYNFAMVGGQAPGHYFLLRRAIEAGTRPRAIVVEYLPRLMAADPVYNVENWPFVATPAECLEMARATADPGLFTDLALRELLPSVRCRNSIRAHLMFALNGTFSYIAAEIVGARRNWEVNRGAHIEASRPGRIEDVESWMREYFASFRCADANRYYIEKLLDLASRHRIPVFWALPPYKPELQARCERSGFDSAHEGFLRSLQARYPGLRVIDGRHAGYDPGVFIDLHHLGREGAATFSSEVARLLRRSLDDPSATPRWLELATYRASSTAGAIEDMDESRRKVLELAMKKIHLQGTARVSAKGAGGAVTR